MDVGSVAAITALVLNPFGAVPDQLQAGKPYFGFEHDGPVLSLVRVQKAPVKTCQAWTEALISVPATEWVPLRGSDTASLVKGIQRAWEPWDEKDLDAVKDCDDFPCKSKLNEAEVKEMAKAPEAGRLERFYTLVAERVQRYLKTGARKEYEIPGDPIDPWKVLEERGFKTSLSRPSTTSLFARKLNFAPDRMLTMHQVLDRRASRNSQGTEAVVWVRDAYDDHYFDSWGEWSAVTCDPVAHEAVVIQALLSEMDLLKQKNILARTLFGKYRSAYESNGRIMLDREFEALKKTAQKIEAEAPVPAKSSSRKTKAPKKAKPSR